MKKPTKSIITSTLLALAFGAMSVGTTFALFTSEASTTINVGAAEVKLGQTLAIQSVSELGDVAVTADSSGVYTNSIGGKTYVDAQNPLLVHFEKWAPGDKAVIKITNNNLSNVTIKTRFRVDHTSTSTPDLWGALTKTYAAVDANNQDIGYKFMDWSPVEPTVSKISDVTVTITFPDHDAGEILFGDANQDNNYQNCNCSIMFTQEAVQGNAQTDGILDKMNAALDAAAATAGRNKTMHDALLDIYAATPSLNLDEALIKTAGYVWNVNTDQFYYGQENVTNEYFKICDEMPLTQTNSIYASSAWNVAEVNLTGVGFDAGSASGITAINYVGAQQARSNVIRTNSAGTTLTINAPQDTVKHYGEAGFLNIIAVANSSYHEHGYIPQAQIAKGRVVNEVGTVEVEGGATKPSGVENLFIVAATAGSGTEAGTFNEIIVEAAQGASVPALDRTDVNIVGAVLVVEVKTAQSDDFVYLTKSGIIEQVVVTSEKGNTDTTTEKATYGTDDALNDASSKAAYEIANIVKRGENGRPVKDDGVTEMNEEEVAAIETVNDIVIEEPKASIDDIAEGEGEDPTYAGGAGTKGNPYLLANEDMWKKLADACKDDSDYSETNGKYYKILNDIDVSKYVGEQLNLQYFAGSMDWNWRTFSGLSGKNGKRVDSDGNTAIFNRLSGNAVIENMNFTTYTLKSNNGTIGNELGNSVPLQLTEFCYGNVTIRNINIYGSAVNNGSNNIGLIAYGYGDGEKLTLEHIYNYSNVTSTRAGSSVFIGAWGIHNIEFNDCVNYGVLTSNGSAGLLFSNLNYGTSYERTITINDCANLGVITFNGNDSKNPLFGMASGDLCTFGSTVVNGVSLPTYSGVNKLQDLFNNDAVQNEFSGNTSYKLSVKSINVDDNMFILESVNDASKYTLSFTFAAANHNGGIAGYILEFSEIPSNIMVGSWITKAEAEATGKQIVAHSEYGTTYYTCDGKYVFYEENARFQRDTPDVCVTFIAYGADDAVLSVATYEYEN